jgi:F-box-like
MHLRPCLGKEQLQLCGVESGSPRRAPLWLDWFWFGQHVCTPFSAPSIMPLPLPIEIVEYILDLAGAFPDLSDHTSPPYSLYSDHDLPLSAIKVSTGSLFSLVLVCKQWNTICTPRLYRCLAIVDDTAIDALLRTIEQSQITTTISGRMPFGSLTRHLIIALSDSSVNDNESERFERRIVRRFGNLGRLARCLPHLELLSISIFTQDMWGLPLPYYGKDFAATVTQTCAPSLLKLHLHHGTLVLFSRPELRKLLESSPRLLAISGADVGDCIGCPVTLPYLPKLKYLAVNSKMGRCDHIGHEDNRTPLLDHIHIRRGLHSDHWVHLLSVQGASLTSVSLDLRLSDPGNCSEYLSKITKFCPNLSYLEICIDNWLSFPQLEMLPTVERFGIHVQSRITSVDTICKTLATIRSPSLKFIQLMSPGMFEDNVRNVWSPLLDHSFRVVDCDGRELTPLE